MGTTPEDIAEWFRLGIKGGYESKPPGSFSHMIVVCDDFDYSDFPRFVPTGDNPSLYTPGSMERFMEVYDLRRPLQPQLDQRRAWNVDLACALENFSKEWLELVFGETPAPPPPPVTSEVDPEIEALLREEEEIERTVRKHHDSFDTAWLSTVITPMTGDGWYMVYNDRSKKPVGPMETMAEMCDALSLAMYPKDGYIMYAEIMDEDGRFWMDFTRLDEIDPLDLLAMPTWATTLNSGHRIHDLTKFYQTAKLLGYPFIAWNGQVYVSSNLNLDHPVCTVEDLQ